MAAFTIAHRVDLCIPLVEQGRGARSLVHASDGAENIVASAVEGTVSYVARACETCPTLPLRELKQEHCFVGPFGGSAVEDVLQCRCHLRVESACERLCEFRFMRPEKKV